MSKELPQPRQSDEVDVGQLFKLIGNAFDRLFKFLTSIFIGLYKLVLMLLVHFYNRMIWYTAVVILGIVVGFIMDSKTKKLYGANMFIETNFNSARQVYENIKQFNQLAGVDRDSMELARRLNITPSEAAQLKGFYVEQDLDENTIAQMYSNFYTNLDSISRLKMTYDRYKESLTPYNFKIHRIGIASSDRFIYKKIEDDFVSQISNNTYLEELLKVNKENLERQNQTLEQQIQKTDSLVNEYLKIRINESQKEPVSGAGTNLYMGNADGSNLIVNESDIVEKRLVLETLRREVNQRKVEQQNVVNVISGFPESGYDIREWYDKMKFLLPLVLFSATLLIFVFLGLGKYLEKESKNL